MNFRPQNVVATHNDTRTTTSVARKEIRQLDGHKFVKKGVAVAATDFANGWLRNSDLSLFFFLLKTGKRERQKSIFFPAAASAYKVKSTF